MIALIVCSRFSAWSKAMLAGEENTSSVTSSPPVMPVASATSRPTFVRVSWNAGRQCMNLTRGFPVLAMAFALTWYGARSFTRVFHTSCSHPSSHVGMHEACAAQALLVVGHVTRAPDSLARPGEVLTLCPATGPSAQIRTSEPMIAPITSSDRPMLNLPPMKQ